MSGDVDLELEPRDRAGGGRLAHLSVAYPARSNVLNTPILEALLRHLETLAADPLLRVVVLRGAGERAFIGGADIYEMARLERGDAGAFISRIHRLCAALRELPAPVIARIGGYCLGAGLEVALSCDLRVAAEGSVFGMPEVMVGVPSVIEAALLPRFVGAGRARELVLTGRRLDAHEAADWGLVERVVPRPQLDRAVEEWVDAIFEAGAGAVALQKQLCRKWDELPLGEAVEAGVASFVEAWKGPEPGERMRGWVARRQSRKVLDDS